MMASHDATVQNGSVVSGYPPCEWFRIRTVPWHGCSELEPRRVRARSQLDSERSRPQLSYFVRNGSEVLLLKCLGRFLPALIDTRKSALGTGAARPGPKISCEKNSNLCSMLY